ncbi:hypothetical protein MK805_09930 [Shimazuella sp. AN120528]|uniref:hypothetical protein n=1 Tax=Shimazuella soli TaxID=1892854 RepID=UPI001F0CFE25|nr:hypothetical protein [Shimazuella soli]MCH5585287.1 hypothetical protein [Shimazuella soli]
MLTLLSDPISPGFVYQSAVYRNSDSREHPCRVGYYRVEGDENRIELHGYRLGYDPLRTMRELLGDTVKSTPDKKAGRDKDPRNGSAFIRCGDLFLFAPKLVIEKDKPSDLLIEGDWSLERLTRTDGEKLEPCKMGETSYSCPFSEMFQL